MGLPGPSAAKPVSSMNMPKASDINQFWPWHNHAQEFLELLLKCRLQLGIFESLDKVLKFSQDSPPMPIPVVPASSPASITPDHLVFFFSSSGDVVWLLFFSSRMSTRKKRA